MTRAGNVVSEAVRALAEADFTRMAANFSNAGFNVDCPARGILQIGSPLPLQQVLRRRRLLLSVGVHGDETAPIEILAEVLHDLYLTPHKLGVDLMVVVGNPAAIAQRRRYIDADMNRMFRFDRASLGDVEGTAEARRADAIMQATSAFFAAQDTEKWHLDLHAAIRPSLYPAFAIVPDILPPENKQALLTWLGSAGIDAAVLNKKLAGTFSAFTAAQCDATACTAELGQVGVLGANDLAPFAAMRTALETLLRSDQTSGQIAAGGVLPHVFEVVQEIVKHSNAFQLAFDHTATKNFTPMQQGAIIAQDGSITYKVEAPTEYVIFPNPNVKIGQRAGLMVVRHS